MFYYLDGTYAGYLTAVFESFERKEFDVIPLLIGDITADLFRESRRIIGDSTKAERVHQGLKKRLGEQGAGDFYRLFLSEDRRAWQVGFDLMREIFNGNTTILKNFGDERVYYFALTLKKVSRERHRMKAFVRFQQSADGTYVALVEPDFNVLPLIVGFFRKRYADQPWIIYDLNRDYGIHYDLKRTAEVRLSPAEANDLSAAPLVMVDEQEAHFQQLWKRYYASTNIPARKNLKLFLQHVPKRYWKHLTERQG